MWKSILFSLKFFSFQIRYVITGACFPHFLFLTHENRAVGLSFYFSHLINPHFFKKFLLFSTSHLFYLGFDIHLHAYETFAVENLFLSYLSLIVAVQECSCGNYKREAV
jgi:hypothetical protein